MLQSKTGKHSEGPIVWSIDDLGQKVVIDEAEQRTVGEEVGPEAAPARSIAGQVLEPSAFYSLAN